MNFNLDIGLGKPVQEGFLDDAIGKANAGANKLNDADNQDIIKNTHEDPNKNGFDTLKAVNDHGIGKLNDSLGKIDNVINKRLPSTSSIVARARNSVLQFPIYVTQSIRINEAQIIAKSFERVYATLVQSVLSQNLIMDEEDANNLVFLKQFHTNLREATDAFVNRYYEPIDNFDRMMTESIFYSGQITKDLFVEFRVIPTDNQDLITENARLMNEPLKGLVTYMREADDRIEKSKETSDESGSIPERVLSNEMLEKLADKAGTDVNSFKEKIRSSVSGVSAGVAGTIFYRKKDGVEEYYIPSKKGQLVKNIEKPQGPIKSPDVIDAVDAPKLLKDSDLKKINGMLPFTIEASFRLRTKQGLDRDVKYVIGVKSVLHLISPKDLGEDLRGLVTGNVKSLQKVRYKTGEITFSDYMFNIKGLKADAAKHINYDKRWINTLKRLGEYQHMHGNLLSKGITQMTGGHAPIPNGTLILSQPDITKLTNETGIDLSQISNARRLAKTLFLIGIVIVDSTAGTMRVFFPDSDQDWDVQSMAALDAELAKTDNSNLMKEFNRFVNR